MKKRAGFTLIEVLVVLAIIGILMALLIPAVQAAREAANGMTCRNNLRQLGLAITQYADLHGQLPAGEVTSYRSGFVAVLPFLEGGTVYDAYNMSWMPTSVANLTAELARPGVFVCPSDSEMGSIVAGGLNSRYPAPDPPGGWPVATTSYGLMFGTLVYIWNAVDDNALDYDPRGQMDGSFNGRQRITIAGITDGLSNTAFASERALGVVNTGRASPYGQWTSADAAMTLLYAWHPPNRLFRDRSRAQYWASLLPGQLVSSGHPGGANVLFGDASVRFVKDSIDSWPIDDETLHPHGATYAPDGWDNVPAAGVWQALVTRKGGELVPTD